MKTITREEVSKIHENYAEIMDRESHHDHEIIILDAVVRWKRAENVAEVVDEVGINKLLFLFRALGLDKNSEPYRKLYRDLGCSLYGYHETFYWEENNPDCERYRKFWNHEQP